MPTPLTHLYALALRALDAHERRAAELRGRLAPVLAAAAAGLALLAAPSAPALAAGGTATALALLLAAAGLMVAGAAAWRMLAHQPEQSPLDARTLLDDADVGGCTDDEGDLLRWLIDAIGARGDDAKAETDWLGREFTVVMSGILVMMCGLAIAALLA
jgi:hypothetical protein